MTIEDCEKHAKENNLCLGDSKRVEDLLKGINKNIEQHGKGYCPCRIQRIDDNICPCIHCIPECKSAKGSCICGMYRAKKITQDN